ncbi:hypothetical protein CVE34_01185 [Pseudomonas syringae pv. actinidiae]|nr:hypothetical protein [Pseudomonas syringae pv. actinidiae]NAS70187.1 hypothetical protein [Pseudomonas syringae pv. actinidiae]NAS75952.1 hypothetical protein [Pseudomonas syringae pv. actinidiae]NAT00389.1 hypothetical protein [Pseudomonas syringae pv. actinidiae]NAT05900.1 hypothetical protein [Pseudomonas syringae pv. actinidiae]
MNPAFEQALQARLLWLQVRSYGSLGFHQMAREAAHKAYWLVEERNRPGNSSSVAGSIVLRDCATMKLSPQCRSGTAGHHHPSQTRSKHFLVLSTIETLEIPFKRCWIT